MGVGVGGGPPSAGKATNRSARKAVNRSTKAIGKLPRIAPLTKVFLNVIGPRLLSQRKSGNAAQKATKKPTKNIWNATATELPSVSRVNLACGGSRVTSNIGQVTKPNSAATTGWTMMPTSTHLCWLRDRGGASVIVR